MPVIRVEAGIASGVVDQLGLRLLEEKLDARFGDNQLYDLGVGKTMLVFDVATGQKTLVFPLEGSDRVSEAISQLSK